MQLDIVSLCLLAIIVILVFAFMSRVMGSGRGYPGGGGYPRGPESPRADDPDIQSGGSIGGRAQPGSGGYPGRRGGSLFPTGRRGGGNSGEYPGRQGGSLFPPRGGSGGSAQSGSQAPRPTNDDPDIESRGGFGRRK
jgi:uncharacterized protein YgiB involved in biofilm formation